MKAKNDVKETTQDRKSLIHEKKAEELFGVEGEDNQLSELGKSVLKKLLDEEYDRLAVPFETTVDNRPTLCLDFYEERERCLQKNILFEDPEFPANRESLYGEEDSDDGLADDDVVWLRPSEYLEDAGLPQFIADGVSRFDAAQGALGNCYFVAATALFAMKEELFYRVVLPDQCFKYKYAGIFHFQFWRYGNWVDVVIDDRLPVEEGTLRYMRSSNENEFWSCLLEKAYAKLYGSYKAIASGLSYEPLEDFTGGLTEYYQPKSAPKQPLWSILTRALQAGSFISCGTPRLSGKEKAKYYRMGLPPTHAYSVVDLKTVRHSKDGEIDLVRLRNPWGNSTRWNGPWGDKAEEWNFVSEEDRKKLAVTDEDFGEFWMSYEDFLKTVAHVDICTIGPEIMSTICKLTGNAQPEVQPNEKWHSFSVHGQWSEETNSAGGYYKETRFNNPQYLLTIKDEEFEGVEDRKRTMILTLAQKYTREKFYDKSAVAILIYQTYKQFKNRATAADKEDLMPVVRPRFRATRDITKRVTLEPNEYLILVPTLRPDSEGEFLLRALANGPFEIRELEDSESTRVESDTEDDDQGSDD